MKKQILFVGNSYTYFHDMPECIFAPMAAEAGVDIEVRAVTHGGYKLAWYADPENEEGKRLRAVAEGRHFDYIVLQDHSLSTIDNPGEFFDGIRRLKAEKETVRLRRQLLQQSYYLAAIQLLEEPPALLKNLARPFLAAAIMGVLTWLSWFGLKALGISSRLILCGAPIAVGVIVYCLAAVKLKVITREDCLLLPKGAKIAKLLRL